MSEFNVQISKIHPTEYKKLGKLTIQYGITSTKFGKCLLAFHENTLCYLSFFDDKPNLLDMQKTWSNATLIENNSLITTNAKLLFENTNSSSLQLYLKGTEFEVGVWEALLKIKKGNTASYQEIARAVGNPNATRAAARAVAKNHVAFFVPCHRVIAKDGSLHKYRWGAQRKLKMLKEEDAI